jgi:hypothetical protein
MWMMTDERDIGRRMKSSATKAVIMMMATLLVLDVSAGQTVTDMSRGETLWSWTGPVSGDGQELSDSIESPSDSENEFLLQLTSDTNWTSYLNETDDDDEEEDDTDEVDDDAVIFEADSNGTNWWTSPVYPSGYTPLGLVIASIFVTFIMIIIVGGNILVIIAIATERSLKGIQNWFIGSLAVADCLLGLIIMPFSLANEMMGYWVFGQWWCDVHSAVDVLLCTSSIMNLCLISLDRYWSITHAIEYLRKRTPERCVIMITTVWILSGLVSIPPLLGWKKETPQGEFPKCEVGVNLSFNPTDSTPPSFALSTSAKEKKEKKIPLDFRKYVENMQQSKRDKEILFLLFSGILYSLRVKSSPSRLSWSCILVVGLFLYAPAA